MGAIVTSSRALLSMLSHDGVGGTMPKSRKLRPLPKRMMRLTVKVTATIGALGMLGSTCARMV